MELLKDVRELLKEHPEIVLCKDCKHKEESVSPSWEAWCNRLHCGCDNDWFCADGERKERSMKRMNTEPELLNERLKRLAIVLDELMPRCAELVRDALALLKEQDAVEPVISESHRTQSGRMSRRRAWCGSCGLGIRIGSNKQDRSNYCERCGRKVKWE